MSPNTHVHTAQHNTQYTIHNTKYTVHSTQYTIHSTQYTIHNSTAKRTSLCARFVSRAIASATAAVSWMVTALLSFCISLAPAGSMDWRGTWQHMTTAQNRMQRDACKHKR